MAEIKSYNYASGESPEQKGYTVEQPDIQDADARGEEEDTNYHLHRGLKSRQITMIAIGGAIGTCLIIGT